MRSTRDFMEFIHSHRWKCMQMASSRPHRVTGERIGTLPSWRGACVFVRRSWLPSHAKKVNVRGFIASRSESMRIRCALASCRTVGQRQRPNVLDGVSLSLRHECRRQKHSRLSRSPALPPRVEINYVCGWQSASDALIRTCFRVRRRRESTIHKSNSSLFSIQRNNPEVIFIFMDFLHSST